jgi:hypothetical protein
VGDCLFVYRLDLLVQVGCLLLRTLALFLLGLLGLLKGGLSFTQDTL